MTSAPRVLFIGRPYNRASWYRCVLPAMFGSWDWASIGGTPPRLELVSSWVGGSTAQPDFKSYDVIVMQQPSGRRWHDFIKKLRALGIVVLYEIDDYVHGVRKADDHDFRTYFDKDYLKAVDICMRVCDGVICSTEFLGEMYQPRIRDRKVWVCENGLDLGRYRLTRPQRGEVAGRETVTILWAGATGHTNAAVPWMSSVSGVMKAVPHASFASVGQDFAAMISDDFPDRTVTVPFTALASYPAAMMMGDVSIAPAGKSDWYRSKSQLRSMESQALGIPIVADEHYAPSIIDGETGIVVSNTLSAKTALRHLIEDDELRLKMSQAAQTRAHAEFGMQTKIGAWETAFAEALALRA